MGKTNEELRRLMEVTGIKIRQTELMLKMLEVLRETVRRDWFDFEERKGATLDAARDTWDQIVDLAERESKGDDTVKLFEVELTRMLLELEFHAGSDPFEDILGARADWGDFQEGC